MSLWPHQPRTVARALERIEAGVRRLLVTAPTGTGKTWIMRLLARRYLDAGRPVVAYTNRRLLLEQTAGAWGDLGPGIRAAEHVPDPDRPFQIASVQTEISREGEPGWEPPPADLVLVDEAHMQAGPRVSALLDGHYRRGAAVVGFTATPLGLGGLYDELLVGCTLAEGRECGALVLATHYGPDEPDWRSHKEAARRLDEGEGLSEAMADRVMRTPGLFGRVLEWYGRINPDGRPAVCFGPSVGGSLWLAEQFCKAGVEAAHIDGADVWLHGKLYRTSEEARRDVLAASREGRVKVICNRYVLREGIDCPWWSHAILATPLGLQAYVQSLGRVLRAYPGKTGCTVQDHAGNWHRHGSANVDRAWRLDDTAAIVTGLRQDRLRGGGPQPVRCPKCGMCRVWRSPACPTCGHELPREKVSRVVVQADGTLRELGGDVYRPRRISQKPNGRQLWERMYYRSKTVKGRRTFRQAAALFAQENHGGWPDPSWPFMPTNPRDAFRFVEDVPVDRLVPKAVPA